jgi:hypothetical protein
MPPKNSYTCWPVLSICLVLCVSCTSNISNCPAFSNFVGKSFTLNKAQHLWQDPTAPSLYEITNIGEKPYGEQMKLSATLPIGTALKVEKVERKAGLLGFPWDYAVVQLTAPPQQQTIMAQKLLNYDYQHPWGGQATVIQLDQGTSFPCLK